MSLSIVAVPIGNQNDLTLRAQTVLREAKTLIGEERKVVSRLIKTLSLGTKKIELLNEHSTQSDVDDLLELCRQENVALVSDCGTPNFCDPGFQLVKACRNEGIYVQPLPGASSLMTLLSMSSERLHQFTFLGFLPAKTELRKIALDEIKQHIEPLIIMDTPYRMLKTLEELKATFPSRRALIGINMTQPDEEYLEGTFIQILSKLRVQKAEFVILIYSK